MQARALQPCPCCIAALWIWNISKIVYICTVVPEFSENISWAIPTNFLPYCCKTEIEWRCKRLTYTEATNLHYSGPSLSWRRRWTWRPVSTNGAIRNAHCRIQSRFQFPSWLHCWIARSWGPDRYLSPRCSSRDLLLEKEHEGFRHFCRSEFDAKDALLIHAIRERNVGR